MIELGPRPRFLITRLSAIGDCIHTLPVATALRRHFPDAEIAWVTQPATATLLRNHPAIDRMVVARRDWFRSWRGVAELMAQLRGHFDVAIDPQGLTKSALLARLSGARHRIGFARGQARELSPWLSNTRVFPQQTHVVDRYLELLRPLGVENPVVEFGLPIDPQAAATVEHAVHGFGISGPFALLNPGAGWDSKVWPHERYADVARYLWKARRLPSVVLWAGDQERMWAENIVAAAGGAAYLAPDTSLAELAAICSRAAVFVGSDTGPLHLAAAVGTPCVGMYGPTRPCDCGPYGPQHRALQEFHQDGSSSERRGTDNRAMRAIRVYDVLDACDAALRSAPQRAA